MERTGLKDHWMLWLIIITAFAIVIRSLPAWMNAGWGSDLGIYYGLTKSFIETKEIFSSYSGWGSSYEFFPILYIVTGIGHWIAGVDVFWLLPKLAPIFGGLTVTIFYFLVHELVKKRDIALLSAAFLSVASFHVIQTSHAAPLTMGHFFMLLSLYLYIRFTRDSNRFQIPLLASTLLLVMSHHFTTYFFLISLTAIVFFKSMHVESLKEIKLDVLYLLSASGMAFLYWYLIATTVFNNFMFIGGLQPWYVVGLFYLALLCVFICIFLIRRYKLVLLSFLENKKTDFKRSIKIAILVMLFLFLSEIVFCFVDFPGTNIKMNVYSVLFSLPVIFCAGLGCMGLALINSYQNNWFFRGWFLAIFCSFIISFLTGNSLFHYYDRHIEYLLVPMSLFSAIALKELFDKKLKLNILGKIRCIKTPGKHWLPITTLSLLVISAVVVYPAQDSFRIIDETISDPSMSAIEWMDVNLDRNETVVASDLKLCHLLWAEGFNTTFDETNVTWTCWNFSECISELNSTANHGRVTHILIDDIMRDKAVNLIVYRSVYMTNESYDKFSCQPFEIVYRNATIDRNDLEIHWAEIYKINWR